MSGVQTLLDQQNCILRQFKETLDRQRSDEDSAYIPKPNSDDHSYLTIPRPRIVKRDGEKTERRRLEMENLRIFKRKMDKKMQQKNILVNICDL